MSPVTTTPDPEAEWAAHALGGCLFGAWRQSTSPAFAYWRECTYSHCLNHEFSWVRPEGVTEVEWSEPKVTPGEFRERTERERLTARIRAGKAAAKARREAS